METKLQTNIVHTVNIFNREKLEITGVIEVISSTDTEATIKLDDMFMIVSGTNLTILKLIPEEKLLLISGNVLGLKYISKLNKKSFLKKVFK